MAEGKDASAGFSRRLAAEYRELWQIGEESGQLDRTTTKIAEISADRAELYLTEFYKWLPRIIYFLIMIRMVMMIGALAARMGQSYTVPI